MKKIVSFIFVLICFSFLFFLPKEIKTKAYLEPGTGGGVAGLEVFEKKVYGSDEIQNASHINLSLDNTIASFNNKILGCTTEECQTKMQANSGGAVGTFVGLIGNMYANPPASGRYYLANMASRFGLVQPVYAQQGIGFSKLQSLLPLWRMSRNIAYIFFIIIFVFIGFAIMFRAKISPQAVITIQSALPKIVTTLILVTFSYAIAGLMIDLIYLIIAIGVYFLAPVGNLDVAAEQQKAMTLNFGQIIGYFTKPLTGLFVGFGIAPIALGLIAGLISTGGGVIAALIGGLPLLILAIIILGAVFKLFIGLILTYIKIILSIISAPLQIMMGAIPGSQINFGSWLKKLFSYILVFPTTAIFLLLGSILIKNTKGPSWSPPGLSSTGSFLTAIIGFGVLLMVAKIPDIIQSAFEGKVFPYGEAIGQTMMAPGKTLLGAANMAETASKSMQGGMLGSLFSEKSKFGSRIKDSFTSRWKKGGTATGGGDQPEKVQGERASSRTRG